MPWVSAGEFFFHLGIAVLPKVGDVFGHLPRAVVGSEDVDEERNAACGDGGGVFGADELGEFGGEKRIVFRGVGDFCGVSGREVDALRAMHV